uniref:Cytidyltransferase-like domain-containing protein n=1 Tax=Globisporangium ultimum (strain ATCC 200006 / CBS 805.95 / DAOM BR144) TaxID=431595 RepID=K3WUW0_GLOUD
MKEVLLYGTSANPPTGLQAHMGAVAYCRSLFDEVWLLPVYQHIYSSKRQLAPFPHRVQMCKLVTNVLPKDNGALVKVQECERELFEHLAAQTAAPEELRIGSIDLIKYLREQHPDASFTLLLGADTYNDLRTGKWKNGDELQTLVKLLVMDRKGVDAPSQQHENENATSTDRVRFIHIPGLSDLSSTKVRATRDVNELRSFVGADVAEYIVHHRLYGFADE